MRKHILVRPFNKFSDSEVKKAEESFNSVKAISALDPSVFSYPATQILVAESDKPILFMPVQTTYMLESLGPTVEASDLEIAAALKQMTQVIHWEACKAGIGEYYMLCSHQRTQDFAQMHGYEEVLMKIYRRKVRP